MKKQDETKNNILILYNVKFTVTNEWYYNSFSTQRYQIRSLTVPNTESYLSRRQNFLSVYK